MKRKGEMTMKFDRETLEQDRPQDVDDLIFADDNRPSVSQR